MNITDQSTAFPVMYPRPEVRRRNAEHRLHRQPLWQWSKTVKQFKEVVAGWALMSAGSTNERAHAVTAHAPFSASLGVTPPIAGANAPRVLTITANFPLGCGPTGATFSCVTADGMQHLVVHLDCPNPNFAFYDLALVPYTVEVTYTPSDEGDLPVRIMTSDGVRVGDSVVITRGTKRDDAHFDVTGKWVDPAAKETGLAFVAESPCDDVVVGTWDFHDHQGVSRRYSIQSVHWNEPELVAEGAIFETTPSSAYVPSTDLASTPPVSANQLGLARITFNGRDCARIFALGFGGNVLFTSNLVRSTF